MRLSHLIAAWVVATIPAVALAQDAGPSAAALAKVAPSVLRVVASGCTGSEPARAGSGFAWPAAGQVVTDLHVVAGCSQINVGYQQIDDRPAHVTRVLVAADLALLTVDHPPDVPTLPVASEVPPVGAEIDVFGFALGQPTRDTHPLHLTFANQETPKLSDALPDDLRAEVRGIGYPALDTQVLRLDGNLLPGHSGAPLLDAQGRVVGIGSGGLERGAVGVGWAVRARYLAQLQASNDAMPGAGAVAQSAFATPAPSSGKGDDVMRCGDLTLIRRRIAPLGDIAASADDPAMLQRLAVAARVPLEQVAENRFGIWTDPASAAGVVLPIKLPVQPGADLCVIDSFVPSVRYLVRVVALPGTNADPGWADRVRVEERRSADLIQQAVGGRTRVNQPDTWTDRHAEPGGFTVRRMFSATDAEGHVTRIYRSDAAGRGAYILGAVIETDARPPGQSPPRVRDAWARGVFAINLSGFPQSN
jgi:hypothetical protein